MAMADGTFATAKSKLGCQMVKGREASRPYSEWIGLRNGRAMTVLSGWKMRAHGNGWEWRDAGLGPLSGG